METKSTPHRKSVVVGLFVRASVSFAGVSVFLTTQEEKETAVKSVYSQTDLQQSSLCVCVCVFKVSVLGRDIITR